MATSLHHTSPITAMLALGFGTSARRNTKSGQLEAFASTEEGVIAIVGSAGMLARRLVSVIASLDGEMSANQLAFQTPGVDPVELDDAIERLISGGILRRRSGVALATTDVARRYIGKPTMSLADPNATTSDILALICRTLSIPTPGKKQERIDAIAAHFADEAGQQRVLRSLSPAARELLNAIATKAGPASIESDAVGIPSYLLRIASAARYSTQKAPTIPAAATLHELTSRGLVGMVDYDSDLWIWQEAWPVVAQPFYRNWASPSKPTEKPIDPTAARLPAIATTLDRALRLWETSPPPALKNTDPRIGKADVKAAAKTLGANEAIIDLAARLAIDIGLLRRNIIGTTGKGRNQRAEEAWMLDATIAQAWFALPPHVRWARLIAAWFNPTSQSEIATMIRHLLTWQLSTLDDGIGYDSVDVFTTWFTDRHWPLSGAVPLSGVIDEIRALGLTPESGALGLTTLARRVLDDPNNISDLLGASSTKAAVQSDLSIVAPPDLRDDLTARISSIAIAESSAGATIFRLDDSRITRTVQAGATADELIDFLTELAPGRLPDTVVRLIRDAAAKAGTVRLLTASTVIVVTDPADLVTACSIKALNLTRIADTVAITDVALAKVTAALEKKGLTPESVVSTTTVVGRSSADEAAEVLKRAAALRAAGSSRTSDYFAQEASRLEARAKALKDVDGRLKVSGPLAPTVDVLARLTGETTK